MKYYVVICWCLLAATCCISCRNSNKDLTPKPEAYFRIDLPEHQYEKLDTILPFSFDKSTHSEIVINPQSNGSYWIDLNYPKQNATFKFTYLPIRCADSLRNLIVREESMVKFHYQKADDVQFDIVNDPEASLWGQIYHIEGKEVATPLQFWMTDSSKHFIRATLYFNFAPNNDSLQPVIEYLCDDAMRIVKSFEWTK